MLDTPFNCMFWRCRVDVVAVVCLVVMSSATAGADDADGVRFFREKIEPVLKVSCYSCHSRQADEVQGGLRLDFKAGCCATATAGRQVAATD